LAKRMPQNAYDPQVCVQINISHQTDLKQNNALAPVRYNDLIKQLD